MNRFRLVYAALMVLALALVAAAAASDAIWVESEFDPFASGNDSAYIELEMHGDALAFVMHASEGSLPAEVSSDLLPLDDAVFTDDSGLMETEHPVALYGGLAVETGVGWVAVQLEGDGDTIHDAILARLADLGVRAEEDGMIGGPVRSYLLSDGGDAWRIAISPNGEGALVHLQARN